MKISFFGGVAYTSELAATFSDAILQFKIYYQANCRMKQTNLIVVSLILLIVLAIYFSYKWTNHDKVELDAPAILKVTMCYVSPICDSTILLTRQQTDDFVKKWNTGISLGYNKYQCQYYVEVYLTNGKKRTFCISQDKILEGSTNGWIFSVGDKNYFDSLYQINKATLRKHEIENYK